jgi:hypothetical protein
MSKFWTMTSGYSFVFNFCRLRFHFGYFKFYYELLVFLYDFSLAGHYLVSSLMLINIYLVFLRIQDLEVLYYCHFIGSVTYSNLVSSASSRNYCYGHKFIYWF